MISQVTTLARFSARSPAAGAPSNSTAEGTRVRCFERVMMCRLIEPLQDESTWSSAQLLVNHYRPVLPEPVELRGVDTNSTLVVVVSGWRTLASNVLVLSA